MRTLLIPIALAVLVLGAPLAHAKEVKAGRVRAEVVKAPTPTKDAKKGSATQSGVGAKKPLARVVDIKQPKTEKGAKTVRATHVDGGTKGVSSAKSAKASKEKKPLAAAKPAKPKPLPASNSNYGGFPPEIAARANQIQQSFERCLGEAPDHDGRIRCVDLRSEQMADLRVEFRSMVEDRR